MIFLQCQKDLANYSDSSTHKVFRESVFQATISAPFVMDTFPKLEFMACAV